MGEDRLGNDKKCIRDKRGKISGQTVYKWDSMYDRVTARWHDPNGWQRHVIKDIFKWENKDEVITRDDYREEETRAAATWVVCVSLKEGHM